MKGHKRSGGSRKFVYREREASQVKARATGKNIYSGVFKPAVRVWKPSEGTHSIRFMPPTWPDADHYGIDIYMHRFVGPQQSTVLCPKRMFNKPCPICDASDAAEKEGEESDAKALRAARQVGAYIIDRDKKGRPEIELWLMPWTVDQEIAAICYSAKTGEVIYLDHPELGYDVNFTREGTRLNTRYRGFTVDRKSSLISDDSREFEALLEFVTENPIPDMFVVKKFDELKSLIDGTAEDEEDEDDVYKDDEDERPAKEDPASRKRAPTSRRRDEDEDEDEEDEEDGDRDEEPRSRKRSGYKDKRRTREYDDDDDDDDDDDQDDPYEDEDEDEDEDDEPSRRRKDSRKGKVRGRY
jgi:hypothetical protein